MKAIVKLLLCGGGTGGHIYPALAVVAELRQQGVPHDSFMWIGSSGQIEETLVPRAGIRLETIRAGGIAGLPWRQRVTNAARLARGLGQASRLLGEFRPNVVLMTGGYINA
ncbi:MAG: glycosyltransferase, partial [Candidatus Promineifilaceae bacterium]|nr:glycosyltransferase [Candidatus Promineifilaceae bacterium]